MKPDEVLRLREAANELSQFSSNPEFVHLADHVAAELQHYDHDGKPLPVDREWLLGLGGRDTGDLSEIAFGGKTGVIVGIGSVWAYHGDGDLFVANTRDFTRPRFLALLAGLGIEVKHGK